MKFYSVKLLFFLLVPVFAFAIEGQDQSAYCNYTMEQAMAQRDLLRTPSTLIGATQPNTGTPAQMYWGISNSLANDKKSNLVVDVARKNCELYQATTAAQQHIQYALPALEKHALQHRLNLIQETSDKLDAMIAGNMRLVSVQTLTRPALYSLQGAKVRLASSRSVTLLSLTSLYSPNLGNVPLRELVTAKQNSEVENQKAIAKLTKQNDWDVALSVGTRHQLDTFVSQSFAPYGEVSVTYNLGSRWSDKHLDRAARSYGDWKLAQEGDVVRNAQILKQQIIEGIEAQRIQLSALKDQDKVIESNLELVSGIDTSAAIGFQNQLNADKLLLSVEIGDVTFRLEELRAFLADNF